eukprot:scaffold52632_cov45-Phaeocystis_antarctica.AAC.1
MGRKRRGEEAHCARVRWGVVQRTQAEDEGVGLVVDESEDVTLRDRVLVGGLGLQLAIGLEAPISCAADHSAAVRAHQSRSNVRAEP